MTGRRVILVLVAVLALTAVLPPAIAVAVNRRRIARAESDTERVAAALAATAFVRARAGVLVGEGSLPRPAGGIAYPQIIGTPTELAGVVGRPVEADPWGNAYVVYASPDHARPFAVVLSAGPNGILDTPFGMAAAAARGDDIVAEVK